MSFTNEQINQVWQKARWVDAENERLGFRKDRCGAWIQRLHHGNRYSDFGWEIDHVIPESDGGTDELGNLQPLQWRNNAAKADGALTCAVTAQGIKNSPTTLLGALSLVS